MKQSSDNRQVKTSNRQIFCPQLRGMNRPIIVRCTHDFSTPDSPDNPKRMLDLCGAVPFCRSSNRQVIVRSTPAIVRFANGLLSPEHKANQNLGETLIFRASNVTSGIISQKRHQAGTKLAPSWHQVGAFRKCLKAVPRGLRTDIEKATPDGISKNRPTTSNSKWQNNSLVGKKY
jgi:hypothetical protein